MALLAALALTACRAPADRLALDPNPRGGAVPDAEAEARAAAERQGWTGLQVLQVDRAGEESYAFYAYRTDESFGPGEAPRVHECWGYTFRTPRGGDGGTGGAGSGCVPASEPPPPQDWSWTSDDPNRLMGTVPLEARAAEVVFADGEVVRIDVLRAGPSWGRAFVSVRLDRPVADVIELRPVLDGEG